MSEVTEALLAQIKNDITTLVNERDALRLEAAYLREKLEIENMRETCTQCNKGWNPSLVESGWCIFCILDERTKERDELKRKVDMLTPVTSLRCSIPFTKPPE